MWDWLRRLLGLEKAHRTQGRLEIQITREPEPEPSSIRTREPEKEWSWPSKREKPLTLLELSKRKHQTTSTEREMPKSFKNRPGVKQAQVNLKKAGYNPNAKIEEDPPRRKRRW